MPNRDCFRLQFTTPRMTAGNEEAEVMLYGEIIPDYSKYYKDAYPNDKSAADFDKAIKEVKQNGAKRLLLRINSPGGIVTQAVAMRGILTTANFEKITIRIEGLCASAATILASVPGAHVVITPGSEYMIHNPWTWGVGNANEMERVVEHLRKLEKTSRDFYAAKTGQEEEQIKQWMDAETWFSAAEAVKYKFADEISQEQNEGEAAACVTSDVMAVMQNLYKAIPSQITVKEPSPPASGGPVGGLHIEGESGKELVLPPDTAEKTAAAIAAASKIVTDGTPVAGAPSEIQNNEEENHSMDINELTAEQLQAQNPALLSQIQQNAVQAERERLDEIDALTLPGYETMAAEAKKNGTSAMDFQKQIVKAQKEKGANFLSQRKDETAAAQQVVGSAAAGSGKTEAQEIEDNAKDIAEYAKAFSASGDGSMF